MVNLYYTFVDDFDFTKYYSQMSKSRLKKIKLVSKEKKKLNVVAELLTWHAYQVLGINTKDINLEYTSKGAPIYDNNFDVSVTHCQNLVMVGISISNIGIDVEELSKINFERLAKRIISENDQVIDPKDVTAVTEMYCAKEAVMKLMKVGVALGFKNIIINDNVATHQASRFLITKFMIEKSTKKFIVAVAHQEQSEVNLVEMPLSEVLRIRKDFA